jgi:hypothetical protein
VEKVQEPWQPGCSVESGDSGHKVKAGCNLKKQKSLGILGAHWIPSSMRLHFEEILKELKEQAIS